MDPVSGIEELVRLPIQKMGYDLVRVSFTGKDGSCLQIMAERSDRVEMSVRDCALISKGLSTLLEEEDAIVCAHTIEVSSPGVERPLVKIADYERFAGYDVKIESRENISGRKYFEAIIQGIEGDCVLLKGGGERLIIPFESIHSAHLVTADPLLRVGSSREINT